MKKLLFGILTFLGIGFSFCSGLSLDSYTSLDSSVNYNQTYSFNGSYNCVDFIDCTDSLLVLRQGSERMNISHPHTLYCGFSQGMYFLNVSYDTTCTFRLFNIDLGGSCPEPEPSTITVLYNNEQSTGSITCNGDNVIQIDGLSTITATNKRTPYFNINYRDEDNQLLTESYSKDILYLSGGLYKKTYTGNNNWILNVLNVKQESNFTGYVPTFDVVFTGDSWEDTGNVFNNFAQNSLQVALSNIPSYIQYVIIILLLFFILGLARRKKRR